MMKEQNVVDISSKGRKPTYGADPEGTLREALACARENGVRAVAVAMIDAQGEEYYLLSQDAADPALLGALEIVKDIVLDDLREL